MSAPPPPITPTTLDANGLPLNFDFDSPMPDCTANSIYEQAIKSNGYLNYDSSLQTNPPTTTSTSNTNQLVPSVPWYLLAVANYLRTHPPAAEDSSTSNVESRIAALESLSNRMRMNIGSSKLWWELALKYNQPQSGLPQTYFDSFLRSCHVPPPTDAELAAEENAPGFDPSLDEQSEAEFNAELANTSPEVQALVQEPGVSSLTPDIRAAIMRGDFLPK